MPARLRHTSLAVAAPALIKYRQQTKTAMFVLLLQADRGPHDLPSFDALLLSILFSNFKTCPDWFC